MAELVTEGLPDQVAASIAAFLPGALKISVVTGAGANTNIAVTGIAADDSVIAAVAFDEGDPVALAEVTVLAGNIKSTTDSTGQKVIVFWLDKSNG